MRSPGGFPGRLPLALGALAPAVVAALAVYLLLGGGPKGVVLTALIAAAAVSAAWGVYAAQGLSKGRRDLEGVGQWARRVSEGEPPGPESVADRRLAQVLAQVAWRIRSLNVHYSSERDKLSTILATMTDGVVLLDGEGRIVLENPAAGDFLDLPRHPEPGRRFIEMVRDHELSQLVSVTMETGEDHVLDLRLGRSRRYLNVIASPLTLQDGPGALLVVHDRTAMQRVETTRREFVANVSHELRTPLASIKASADTLDAGAIGDPEAARQFLDRITMNVDRMSILVRDLLDLSRLESGEELMRISRVDVYDVIDQSAEVHRSRAVEKGVALRVDRSGGAPKAVADAARLQQVLSNLIENAVKFTPAGGWVEARAEPDAEGLRVSVADNGAGMSADALPHVFERFYKADRSVNSGGTGLGLAIAKHIVQSHGGRIWVESVEGEGSVFSSTVPATEGPEGGGG